MRSTDLSSPQTLNLYAYCTNDPINHTDPSGLGFFGFLKNLFKKVVNAIKAAVVAFVVAFVGSGGDFKKARRAATRAFVSSFGFETRVWRPTGTAPTFPTGNGRPELHQIFQGTILSGLFPSPQSYLRFVNGWAGGSLFLQNQGQAPDPCAERLLVPFDLRDAGGEANMNLIHRSVQQDFLDALLEINIAIPGGIGFRDVFRDSAMQARRRAAFLAGRGAGARRPGTSSHEAGMAVDVDIRDVNQVVVDIFRSHGWIRPFANEAWHFEARTFNVNQIQAAQDYYNNCVRGR